MAEANQIDYTSHILRAKRAAGNYLGSIERAYLPPNPGAPAAFILLSCYIDFLGSLYAGTDASSNTFQQFVSNFMSNEGEPSPYDAAELYRSLRSKLVHNYAIWNARYYLTHGRPEQHLSKVKPNGILLNLENFYSDVEAASRRYFADMGDDNDLQRKLSNRLDKVGVIDDVQLRYSGNGFTVS